MKDLTRDIVIYILAAILLLVIVLQVLTFNYIKTSMDDSEQTDIEIYNTYTPVPTLTPIPTVAPTSTPEPTAIPSPTSTLYITAQPNYLSGSDYDANNPVLADIYSRMPYNYVERLYSEPYYVSQFDNRASIGSWSTHAYYEFGSVSYLSDTHNYTDGGKVVNIHVMKEGYEGPNGIKIGDAVSEVFVMLGINYEYYENETRQLYDEYGSEYGEIEYYDSGEIRSIILFNQDNLCMEFYIDFINGEISDFGIYEQLN